MARRLRAWAASGCAASILTACAASAPDWTDPWPRPALDAPLLAGPSVAVDGAGIPWIAYVLMTSTGPGSGARPSRVLVRRWSGVDWEPVGAEVTASLDRRPADPGAAAMILGEDGLPIVAYTVAGDIATPGGLRVARWNGAAWTPLGDVIRASAGATSDPVLARAGSTVVLAWHQPGPPPATPGPSPSEVHVRRWSGTAWQSWDGSAASEIASDTPDAGFPGVAVDGAGHPVILYVDTARPAGTPQRLHVRRWAGAWTSLPDPIGFAATGGDVEAGGIACGTDGAPLVAWTRDDAIGGATLHVRRWDGAEWLDLPDPAAGAPFAGGAALSAAPGGVAIAWAELHRTSPAGPPSLRVVRAARLDGSRWSALGSSIAAARLGAPGGATVALGADGSAVAGVVDGTGSRLRRLAR